MHFSAMHILGNYFHLTTPLIYKRMIRVFITMAYSKAHALLLKMHIGTRPGGKQTHTHTHRFNKQTRTKTTTTALERNLFEFATMLEVFGRDRCLVKKISEWQKCKNDIHLNNSMRVIVESYCNLCNWQQNIKKTFELILQFLFLSQWTRNSF